MLGAVLYPTIHWLLFILITFRGLLGSLFDLLIGATVQAMYFCPKDQKETEKHPLHTCGTETIHIRGLEMVEQRLGKFCVWSVWGFDNLFVENNNVILRSEATNEISN